MSKAEDLNVLEESREKGKEKTLRESRQSVSQWTVFVVTRCVEKKADCSIALYSPLQLY